MKKSTLITTIAMIVVVVVALSTATYAWFSSSATAVATTNFTTNASGDWSMIIGSANPATGSLTFTSAAVDSDTLASTPLQSGLWAPTAVIASAVTDATTDATWTNPVSFVSANKNGNNYPIAGLLTANYNSGNKVENVITPTAGEGRPAPFAIRIMNVSGKEKKLQLNITLNAKNTGLTNSMYAAAAVRFYIFEYSNANATAETSGVAYTSGYTPILSTETATVEALTTTSGNISKGTAVQMTTGLAATTIKKVENVDTLSSTPVSIADYSVANIAGYFKQAESANDNLGISQGDYVLTYTFDMQTYGVGGWSNLIIYAWIDGWVANGSAASADFNVNFGFTSAPELSAGA